jgi:hypothetical protein
MNFLNKKIHCLYKVNLLLHIMVVSLIILEKKKRLAGTLINIQAIYLSMRLQACCMSL